LPDRLNFQTSFFLPRNGGIIAKFSNTTPMQESTQRLVQINQENETIADTAPGLIWMSNVDNLYYCYFNAAWLKFTGRSLEEESGSGWCEGIHPDDLHRRMDIHLQSSAAQKAFKIKYRLRRSDGVYHWVLDHAVPRYNADGSFAGHVGSCIDIQDLLESETLKNQKASAIRFDRYQTLNEELSATNEELNAANEESTTINEQLHSTQERLASLNEKLEDTVAIRTQSLTESESATQALNEELTAINEEMTATNEELIAANDQLSVSKQKLVNMVEQLAASEYKTRSIVETAPFPIGVYVGPEMRIELANQAILDVWGKGNDVIGKRYADVLPELNNQMIFSQLDSVFSTGQPFHARNQKLTIVKDGLPETFYFNYSFTALRDESGKIYGVMNTAADVTDVIAAKDLIKESEERFRTMAEDTDMLIGLADENSNSIYFNKAWERLTGKSMKELMNYGWAELVHPDDKDKWINSYLTAFENKTSLSGEFRIRSKNGDYRWLYAKVPARFRSDGTFMGYVSSCTDITEIKEDELRKNDFIGMVSHELKTPLTSLTGLVQISNVKLKNGDDVFLKSAMEKASVQLKKMANMINGFLNMSRLESGKIMIDKHPFNLDDLLREVISEMQLTVSSHQIHFAPCDPVEVNADRDKIGSVITNLLSNAVKYSPNGKFIEVECHIDGDMARLSVKDEGVGLRQQDSEKIFDRYHRIVTDHTKNISGFGIGLYLSAEIIERHKGRIWVESQIGVGSTFYFTLPI
jgi:PAS domain S-box-containing protein